MSDAKVMQKIVLTGTLQLNSPLIIGSGTETEARTDEADLHILKNKQEKPLKYWCQKLVRKAVYSGNFSSRCITRLACRE